MRCSVVEEGVQGELGEASLGFVTQNGVALLEQGQYARIHNAILYIPHLSTPSDAESGQKTVSSLPSTRAQHAFDHGDCAGLAEQLQLACIFLENPCESKALHGSLALIVGRWLDGDMRRCRAGSCPVHVEEALSFDIRWP